MRTALVLSSLVPIVLAVAAHGCGPACVDDRCSLTPTQPHVTRVDYIKPRAGSADPNAAGNAAVPAATPVDPAAASGTVAATTANPPAVGPGSAAPPPATPATTDPGTGTGAGSAPPPPPPAAPVSASWAPLGDSFKMYVATRTPLPKGTKLKLEFLKVPENTPFVITLETKPTGGASGAEAAWNDCADGKVRCDVSGAKIHALRRDGQVLIQAGVNWAVTNVADEGKATLVTWTNNLSREVVLVRLSR